MIDTSHFKTLLEAEKSRLENELATVGRKNPSNPADWEATEPAGSVDAAEEGEVADGIEEYETNTAILKQLEDQLADVNAALGKIEAGTYGTCEVCGAEIEADRLEANPSAKTCKAHMN